MKKKYITKDLKKSYLIIIAVVLAVFTQITLFSWNYTLGDGRREVKTLIKFFNREIREKGRLDIKEKVVDALGEIPSFRDISIIAKNDEFEIKQGKDFLSNLPLKDEVVFRNFHRYYVYNYNLYDNDKNFVQITIIKNLKENIEFVSHIFFIFTFVFILLNLMVFILYKSFYKNMISQIKKIESEVNQIDVSNEKFKPLTNKNYYYEENKNIINATNNILTKLNNQKKLQLNFIYSASHEMKTPLTIMKGYTGMLERWAIDDGDKEVMKEYVGVISTTIKDATQLIEKLLFLVENDIELTKEKFSLKDLVEQIFNDLLLKYPNSNLDVQGDLSIFTDRVLIRLLLLNLIENAIKYGDGKVIKVEIDKNSISILNSGKQIEEKNLEKLFDRFYREDKSRNNEVQGHGLGLSIVKVISKELGYQVSIKNYKDFGVISRLSFQKSEA